MIEMTFRSNYPGQKNDKKKTDIRNLYCEKCHQTRFANEIILDNQEGGNF